jgi:hypothetical protein
MAKLNIEFDTSTKELSVSFDGKKLDNVYSVSLSKAYGYGEDEENKFGCSLMTMDEYKDDGYRHMTHLVAKNSSEAEKLIREGAVSHPDFPDFVHLKDTQSKNYAKQLSEYLRRHRERK